LNKIIYKFSLQYPKLHGPVLCRSATFEISDVGCVYFTIVQLFDLRKCRSVTFLWLVFFENKHSCLYLQADNILIICV